MPIGIINTEAVILTDEQLNENVKAKDQKRKPNDKDYENFDLIAVGLLQGEVFQGEVQFRISPDLVLSNSKNEIKGIEIDFQDGKGYTSYKWKEQLISYKFKVVGSVSIGIRLNTTKGNFITYNILHIRQLVRPIPFGAKNIVNVSKVITEKGAKI